MKCKHYFHDYLQVRNIRAGGYGPEGELVAVRLDLIVGPFTFRQVSYHTKARSLRLNSTNVRLKASYVDIIRKMIVEEIKQLRLIVVDKSAE